MEIVNSVMPGVKLFIPTYFDDNRGYSTEAYNDRTLSQCGISNKFVVDYECYNEYAGTIRGIHFQNNPHPQAKLVRILNGSVMDYVVDLRKDSPTYLKWTRQELSLNNRKQLYIPSGYGHAYVTLEPETVVLYKFDDYYDKSLVRAIRWNDPDLGIQWNINEPILSLNDRSAPLLRNSDVNLNIEENSR